MKSYILRKAIALVFAAILIAEKPALADCVNPSAPEGKQVYNSTYKTMQFCDGTNWWSMKSGGRSSVWIQSGSATYYNNGNVGVGTDTPLSPLHVAGGIRFDAGVLRFPDGSTMTTAAAGDGGTYLDEANNLSDLDNVATARTNLGLGTAATKNEGSGNGLDADTLDGLQASSFVQTETDPQVAATTNGNWCRGNGSAVTCDQSAPSGIPSGAVMAFNLGGCPSGWSDFGAGQGRFIVGVGGGYGLGATGGANTVALSVSQMPSHNHRVYMEGYTGASAAAGLAAGTAQSGLVGFNSTYAGSGYRYNPGGGGANIVESTGSGSAHENRPPYVALRLCQKN